MKNKLLYTTLIGLSASLLSGCNEDKVVETATPAVIQGIVYAFDVDEAGVHWQNNQMIGVTMLKTNTTEVVKPYQNITYTTTAFPIGYFTPVTPDDVLNYPEDGSQVDLIAYYPYQWKIKEHKIPVDVSDQKAKTKFDLIYANNCKALSKENKKTKLELYPVVSEITLKLEAGDGVNDEHLANAVITLTGMPTTANFNLLSGSFEEATNVQNILLPALPQTDGKGGKGYTLPAVSTEGYKVRIDLPSMANRVETREVAELFPTLERGTRYMAVARVSLTKIEFINVTQEPIKDWEEGDKIAGSGTEHIPNLINAAIEDLPVGAWTAISADAITIGVDKWCLHLDKDMDMTASIQLDATLQRNILYGKFNSGAQNWYKQYVAYRMKDAEPVIYTLNFRAKGSGTHKCFFKTNDSKTYQTTVFVANNKVSGAKPYNGYVMISLSNTYKDYSLDFNFSKLVKDPYGFTEADLRDATPEALSDFYLGIAPITVGNEFYIDQVSLKRKK